MGEVTVRLEHADKKATGRGASTDVIEASAKAYVSALNKLASESEVVRARDESEPSF